MTEDDGLQRCGLGIRGIAMTVDSFVWLALFMIATLAIGAATGQVETTANEVDATVEGTAGTVAFLTWLGLGVGYHTVLEWKYGKTLGKYLVGIEAVEADGSVLSLRSSLVRNLLRLIDWLPMFYGIAIVLVAISSDHERLGDRLGGTAVVRN
ncbi:RDD domain containing protein [Salinarchaeum sp. Harcht-Bsk1]|uniref:RDD family protein n=1 Tax=Salinarchaeum sp. Harcht-Bsk1 TaxID=1333523 RepID=UPI0003423BA4|nr:RDD family protein [Salinarchaeum sp. Harcht-Bsk1]AGN00861.1 RDD domain containing protein [Salinarchaeum sp. Harcht-Bsk1]